MDFLESLFGEWSVSHPQTRNDGLLQLILRRDIFEGCEPGIVVHNFGF